MIRLLLLRSRDPRRAALAKDCIDLDHRLGLELALGELSVIIGGLGVDGHGASNRTPQGASDEGDAVALEQATGSTSAGRTPLNLVEDDYREELEEASELSVARVASIANALASCGGEDTNGTAIASKVDLYECWATLSILLLAAGTPGTIERVKEALGGSPSNGDDSSKYCFAKPCQDVVQDFQSIHKACQSLEEEVPVEFKELAKKFLQGVVDKKSIGRVSDLKNQWERRSNDSLTRCGH